MGSDACCLYASIDACFTFISLIFEISQCECVLTMRDEGYTTTTN